MDDGNDGSNAGKKNGQTSSKMLMKDCWGAGSKKGEVIYFNYSVETDYF